MLGTYWLISESCLFSKKGITYGSRELIQALQYRKLPFAILTNHSSHLRTEMAAAYDKAGLHGIRSSMFYTSAMAGTDAILKAYPKKRIAGYIGGRGLQETLQEGGFAVNLDRADWLFIGTDRHASYDDYSYGLRLMKSGAQLVSTDPRKLEILKNGPVPGSGSIVKMLEYAGSQEALECGMPSPLIATQAMHYLKADPNDTIFVGAHLKSEIQCGISAGLKTVLTASSLEDTEEELLKEIRPDYMIDTLEGLLR
ncbi:MAG: hypothetical protein EOM64_09900 [Erysipelotrichia bacterium]|nr:hypothetical protein [Erysipelotrichia bacterium]